MNAEELEGQLEGRQTSRDIAEALARMTGEQLVDDLLLAFRGSPLGLHFAQHLPLSDTRIPLVAGSWARAGCGAAAPFRA